MKNLWVVIEQRPEWVNEGKDVVYLVTGQMKAEFIMRAFNLNESNQAEGLHCRIHQIGEQAEPTATEMSATVDALCKDKLERYNRLKADTTPSTFWTPEMVEQLRQEALEANRLRLYITV